MKPTPQTTPTSHEIMMTFVILHIVSSDPRPSAPLLALLVERSAVVSMSQRPPLRRQLAARRESKGENAACGAGFPVGGFPRPSRPSDFHVKSLLCSEQNIAFMT